MLKFDEINKKIKNDLTLLSLVSFFISFLGGLFSYGILTNYFLIYVFIPIVAYLQAFLLEKEIFKYWNNENEVLTTFNLSIILMFLSASLFTFLFFNISLLINIILILFVNVISIIIFGSYYKGYVECLVYKMKMENEQQIEENKND